MARSVRILRRRARKLASFAREQVTCQQFRVRPNDPTDSRSFLERLADEQRRAALAAAARALHQAGMP